MKTSLLIGTVTTLSLLLAQAPAPAPPILDTGLGTLLGNLGIMGVLVWHMWYHTTKTYPMMLDKFSAEVGEMRKSFANEQTALRAAFLTEQAAARDSSARETAELRNMLFQNLQAMRTAVHDVKDTAQTAINRASAPPAVRWETRKETPTPAPEGQNG